jgi:hypothetical protein
MISIFDFTMGLSEEECHQIIREYHQFAKDGWIGDCFLRAKGTEIMHMLLDREGYITTWMKELYVNCLRRFYEKNY